VPLAGLAVLAVAAVAGVTAWWSRDQGTTRAAIGPETVVLLGDSITEFGRWEDLLPDRPVANRGFAGFTSEELVPVAAEVAVDRPRLVLVLAGTNDIRDGHDTAWTERELGRILDELAAAGPGTTVVLQTLLPRADAVAEIDAANRMIVDLAAARGLEVLDLHPAFDDGTGGLRPAETTDGLHLSPAGYERWADLLEPFLAEQLG
jgi:lysophospholipase L1-like esterase